jgi:hypothetical protein
MLGLSLAPVWLVLHLRTSFSMRLAVAGCILVVAASIAVPVREGIWLLTHAGYRFAARLLPSQVHRHQWARGRVALVDEGVVSQTMRAPLQLPVARLAPFLAPPVLGGIDDGLFEISPGGWRAVLLIDGPSLAVGSTAYGGWCDGAVSWLARIGCPAQFLTLAVHADRIEAEHAYERGLTFEPRTGPLCLHERDFAGEMAARSLALHHHVVLAPQSAAEDGMPYGASLRRAATAPQTSRLEAERALVSALQLAKDAGISARRADQEQIRLLLARHSAVNPAEAAVCRAGLWVNGAHVCVLTVTKLPPDIDHGLVVEALQRSEARGAVSLHVMPASLETARRHLRRYRSWLRRAIRQGQADVDVDVAVADVERLQAEMAAGRVRPLRVALTVAVRATSRAACAETAERIEKILVGHGCQVVRPSVPGFLPALAASPGMPPLRRSVHLTTDAVAARLLPVLGTPFADIRAPIVGLNLRSGATAHLSVWSRPNHNAVIVGGSGAGKSVSSKTALVRHVMQTGSNAVVVDPESEYQGVIRLLGGRYFELAECAVNPLGFGRELALGRAAETMVTILSVMAGDAVEYVGGRPIRRLPNEDKSWLHRELRAFLNGWRTAHPGEEPVLSAFLEHLHIAIPLDPTLEDAERGRCRRITARLQHYAQGSLAQVFDRPSSFHIEPGTPVGVGFQSLSLAYAADTTPAIAVVLCHLLEAVGRRRERLIVVVDEAHVLTSDPDAGEVLAQLVRRARKNRAGIWMASQKIDEFLRTDLGRTLAATASTKLILGQEDTVAEEVRQVFQLAEDEVAALTPPVPGRAVLIAGNERTIVQVQPSPVLWPWVRTDEAAVQEAVV